MDRQINILVRGSYLSKDSNFAGVQHESNAKVFPAYHAGNLTALRDALKAI